MERYTYFDGGKWRLKIGDTEYSGDWVDRLAAYEETGLEPEELAQAEKKGRLMKYLSLKKENENRRERLARMKAGAEIPSAREYDGSQHTGGGGSHIAVAVERYIEYEKEIRPIIAENEKEIFILKNAVHALKDPLEREVVRLRYMDGDHCRPTPWREVAWGMYQEADDAAVYRAKRIHDRAISHIAL